MHGYPQIGNPINSAIFDILEKLFDHRRRNHIAYIFIVIIHPLKGNPGNLILVDNRPARVTRIDRSIYLAGQQICTAIGITDMFNARDDTFGDRHLVATIGKPVNSNLIADIG